MSSKPANESSPSTGGRFIFLCFLALVVAGVTFAVTATLINIFERKQEARVPFVRLVEVNEVTTDPEIWGVNWPFQYDTYLKTVDMEESEYGGSSAMTQSKLDAHPWLKRLYAGYAFSIDYRDARGHAYMLHDQEVTKRVTERKQGGACLHCHASIIPTYRRLGLEAEGKPADAAALAADFNWPAVMAGFEQTCTMDYSSANAEVKKTPDHLPDETAADLEKNEPPATHEGTAHPVSCVDCHDPESMAIRVTRPGFVTGIAALAESDDPVPHLPSIAHWRSGKREKPYDPNTDASRQEMRTFVCAQCHVEYYCASKETLFFPWGEGLKAGDIEKAYDNHKFPDGTPFYDYEHGETKAHVYKAQHPEFELWSQGIHARSGVSCADCHMPYERQGAMKVSSHWVRSPMLSINRSCQNCHHVPEEELKARVEIIQDRTTDMIERAAVAMTDMLDAIRAAQASNATPEQLAPILDLQKKAMWRLDFISSENSKGFHADQEATKLLGESIDYSRQAQALALQIRAGEAPESTAPIVPVQGITPNDRTPPTEEKPEAATAEEPQGEEPKEEGDK
ncbi:ammonia-forming cytochrome c nitrite reductase subunit c552 [Blastopirellula sp. JC732]|uniref:nitrite reductase (cytochrome; ammonia-forming) n=1 Tax=Blastopirellula sediminis TaxID=2894196 RepID=A0A9X1MNX5_9BACT|nr:ammonia-forming cytochrome c nitrite reductase subunit c552 [Blastopirellula sediminis]MCC9605918.1 ammonia-forming cytochrome c nitrite reductase subunit c552 [Blastopirellula sediminis]MCC9630783.1 ammonia-forming cytochrome c nitrite reductase subunit c552 [Blastopirellula sediminis]